MMGKTWEKTPTSQPNALPLWHQDLRY